MTRIKTMVVAAVLTAIPCVPAHAQAGTEATAAKLIRLMKMEGVLDTMFQQMAPMMTGQIMTALQQAPDAPADIKAMVTNPATGAQARTIMSEEVMKALRKRYPEIAAASAKEYAATFTEAELQTAIAFYQSPVGQRFVEAQPKLQAAMSRQGGIIGMAAGGEAVPAALARIQALPASTAAK